MNKLKTHLHMWCNLVHFFSHYVEFHLNVFFFCNEYCAESFHDKSVVNFEYWHTKYTTFVFGHNRDWNEYNLVYICEWTNCICVDVLVRSLAVHKSILENSNKIESMIFEPPTKLRELHIPSWRLIIIRNNADLKFTLFFSFFLFFWFFWLLLFIVFPLHWLL